MNNFIQMGLFDSEFPKENLKIKIDDIDWQEILGCSIFTRKEIGVLISKSEDYYIYVLWKMYTVKPVPFYVGKGHFDRVIKHEMPSDKQNKVKNNIINKHQRLGFNVGYSILSWHKEEQDALNREVELIAQIGRADLKQGILTNKTEGGDGTRGHLAPKRGDSYSAKPVYAMFNEISTRFACVVIVIVQNLFMLCSMKSQLVLLVLKMPPKLLVLLEAGYQDVLEMVGLVTITKMKGNNQQLNDIKVFIKK